MKTFVEYCKAIGSLAFGLMIGIGAVMIAVPDYQAKIPMMFAQTTDQWDITVSVELDASSQTDLFSGSTVEYALTIENLQTQWVWETYADLELHLTLPDGLVFNTIDQDQFVINTTPSQNWNTYVFAYLDPITRGAMHTFTVVTTATDTGDQVVLVEVIHPATDDEAVPYASWGCSSISNNVSCVTTSIQEVIIAWICNDVVEASSYYESTTEEDILALWACDTGTLWSFWAIDEVYTRECITTAWKEDCTATRRYCGDGTVDTSEDESCDGSDLNWLSCDLLTCQLIWCTDEEAYNHDINATQDNGECKKMWDGVVDFTIDGILREQCDDGNTAAGDGCDTTGQIEAWWSCPVWWQPCSDIDECADANLHSCDSNAVCTNTIGWNPGYTCGCSIGYEGDGFTCSDIDECADTSLNSCDSNALCTNTVWDYTCGCDAGYEGDGFTCTNIDECALWTDLCDDSWTCTDTDGWYDCSCWVWYYNFQWSLTQNVNTCLEIDECTWQVEWLEGWYQTISDSNSLNQWGECENIWWVCSNEIWWTPWFSCDCPTGYEVDGQWVCQVVYGDSFVVSGVEECDMGAQWVDDGCSDSGYRETPVCDIIVSPGTWTIGTQIIVDLWSSLVWWTAASLIERWDGTIIENPTFPVSTSYTASQQYTITLSVQSTANPAIFWECTTVVAIDTECGNAIPESGEVCDLWDQNWVACSPDFGASCTYCTASCTQETITNTAEAKRAISPWYTISYSNTTATIIRDEQWSADFFRVEYWTVEDDLSTSVITDETQTVITIDEPESIYYIQIVPVNENGEVNWITSEVIQISPIQDVEPFCGNWLYETDTEQCDQWTDNGRVCSAEPWFNCEYCSSICEIETRKVPPKSWWSSSSVSVSVANNTVTQKDTTDSQQESQDTETNESTSKEATDTTSTVDIVPETTDDSITDENDTSLSLIAWEMGENIITHSAAPSLSSLFSQTPTEVTPESLYEILLLLNRSDKAEIRSALERYLLEK